MIDFLGIDTETFLIERGLLAPPMVCYQWADHEWGGLIAHHTSARSIIKTHLEGSEILVGHNVAYDTAVICSSYPELSPLVWDKYERGEIVDTQIAEYLIDIAKGTYAVNIKKKKYYDLEHLAGRYGFEKHGDDPWRLRYGELYDVPLEQWSPEAIQYAAHDPEVVLDVIELQYGKHTKYLGDLEKQCRAAFCLQLMSCWGIHTDPWRTEALRKEVIDLIRSVQADLIKAGLLVPKSLKDPTLKKVPRLAQEMLFNECMRTGMEPKWTAKGLELKPEERQVKHVSLDKDACDLVGNDLLQKYSLYARQNTLKTRIEGLSEGYTYPLQARFNVLKETGRTSSSQPSGTLKGVQMQNFSRKLGDRECIIPRDGMCFIGADLSMAELHTVAQICLDFFGESELAIALNKGIDVHLQLGAHSVGIPYDQALQRKDEEEMGNHRSRAKPANFGFWGGMGFVKFVVYSRAQWGVDFTIAEAREIKEFWRELNPINKAYFALVNELLAGRDYTQIQQVRVDRYRGRVGYCDAANGWFQSLAADGVKEALWLVSKACYNEPDSPLFGWRPWNVPHDEFLLEGPVSTCHDAGLELKRLMEKGFNQMVPDVPTTADPVAMMYWSKKAKPVYDDKGRMIPWTQ